MLVYQPERVSEPHEHLLLLTILRLFLLSSQWQEIGMVQWHLPHPQNLGDTAYIDDPLIDHYSQ